MTRKLRTTSPVKPHKSAQKPDKAEANSGTGLNQILQVLNNLGESINRIDQRVSGVEQVAAALQKAPVALEGRARRKTEHPVVPTPPVEKAKPLTLRERIQEALTDASLDTAKLRKAVKAESLEEVEKCLKVLQSEGKVYNIGYEDAAIWTWKIGNETDLATLIKVVKRLITERPMFVRDIIRSTGASEGRVSGAVVEIQRSCRVEDLSGGGHAKKYFLVGEHWRDATLPGKMYNGREITHGKRRGDRPGQSEE